nr:uncharacterized protein LOC127483409 [Oryctolagus cuniculus]
MDSDAGFYSNFSDKFGWFLIAVLRKTLTHRGRCLVLRPTEGSKAGIRQHRRAREGALRPPSPPTPRPLTCSSGRGHSRCFSSARGGAGPWLHPRRWRPFGASGDPCVACGSRIWLQCHSRTRWRTSLKPTRQFSSSSRLLVAFRCFWNTKTRQSTGRTTTVPQRGSAVCSLSAQNEQPLPSNAAVHIPQCAPEKVEATRMRTKALWAQGISAQVSSRGLSHRSDSKSQRRWRPLSTARFALENTLPSSLKSQSQPVVRASAKFHWRQAGTPRAVEG